MTQNDVSGQPDSTSQVLKGLHHLGVRSISDRTKKLALLRARTDHDLLILVSRELDRGLALVAVATTRSAPVFAQAVKAHDTAAAVLPRIGWLSDGDRLRLESKLEELLFRLDQVAVVCERAIIPISVAS